MLIPKRVSIYYFNMKLIYNNLIPFKGFSAINLFGILFIRKGCIISEVTLNHEAIHSEQMKELWYIPFYILYGIEWLFRFIFSPGKYNPRPNIMSRGKLAYYNISFEREAYKNEKNLDYLKTRKKYQWRTN